MASKMSRKEEAFWKDLAFRMAKHLGFFSKEKVKRARPNCSRKSIECLVVDRTTHSWPSVVMCGRSWRDVVSCMCSKTLWRTGANGQQNIFGDIALMIRAKPKELEKRLIDLELAGFGDLIDAVKKGRI